MLTTVSAWQRQALVLTDAAAGQGKPAEIEFNIEGNPFAAPQASTRRLVSDYPGFMQLVERVRPEQVTLVPDGDEQLTSDHGFDLDHDGERLAPVIEQLKSWGCRVSLFMDPSPRQIERVRALGADRIELYTETYAQAHARGDFAAVLVAVSGRGGSSHRPWNWDQCGPRSEST